jgi:8-oxo-dGTP diphosphatase
MFDIKVWTSDMRLNEKNIIKTGVGVWLFNTSGQVLLGLRLSKHGFNTWSAPGGKPEVGESIRQTAVREAWEETGIVIEPHMLQYVGLTHDDFGDSFYRTVHYKVINVCQMPIVRELDKCAKWIWFDLDKLPKNLFLSTQNLLNQKVFGV